MEVIYSDQVINVDKINKRSFFLAGPTPRNAYAPSWRQHALGYLEDLKFNGFVLVPELQIRSKKYDYLNQVEWEKLGLTVATRIIFWVPRKMPDMPGLTTNVEFGRYVTSGRIYYGRPDTADHIKYLDWLYKDTVGREPFNDLRKMLEYVVSL